MKHNNVASACSRHFIRTFRLLIATVPVICLTARVGAQTGLIQDAAAPMQYVRSVPEQFAADLDRLARRMKVTFVVEGQPIGTQSDTMPPALYADLYREGAAKEDTVKGVAAFYDYSAVRHGSVFVLTKLYTNADDIPDVTTQECYLALKSASQTIAAFNPHVPGYNGAFDPMAANIVSRLTSQQMETLSQQGLPIASLAPPQREEVWRIALYYYVQTQAQTTEGAAGQLEALTIQDPPVHWKQIKDYTALGCDLALTVPHKTLFFPFSHANRILVAPDGTVLMFTNHNTINGVPIEDFDPTDPIAKKPGQITTPAPAVAITLAAAIKPLNKQDKPEPLYQVDAALAAKRVMIVGTGEADGAKLMDALAEVYGLRVRHRDDGVLILTRLRDMTAPDIMGLGKALRGTLPAPLHRALYARMRAQHYPPLKPNQPFPATALSADYMGAAQPLRLAALRQLRALAEPKLRAAHDQQLPLSRLGEQEKALFALSLAVRTFADICDLAERPIPYYIADFDHVVLTGGVYKNKDGENRFSLSLSYTNPKTGESRQGVGFSNARLPR